MINFFGTKDFEGSPFGVQDPRPVASKIEGVLSATFTEAQRHEVERLLDEWRILLQ